MDETWTEADAALVAKARDLEWQQGDRLRHAILTETKRGSAKAAAALATRRDLADLSKLVQVCEAFPDARRHQTLTFEHHVIVLKLHTDVERDEMLARAVLNGWTVRQTRRAVLALRVATGRYQPQIDDDPEDTAMRGIAQHWNRASRSARAAFVELADEAMLDEIEL